jgi:heme/copper-type cytochrome/quinol oxidase subunit 2
MGLGCEGAGEVNTPHGGVAPAVIAVQAATATLQGMQKASADAARREANTIRKPPAETTTTMIKYLIIAVMVIVMMIVVYMITKESPKPNYTNSWG